MFKPTTSYQIKKATRSFVVFAFVWLMSFTASAQCAMCRAALEGEGNVKKAEAVNDGIVYLMLIPYILVGAIGIFIFRMYRNRKS